MTALNVTEVYQVDYQRPERVAVKTCVSGPLSFEQVEVEWPHGPLFNPQSLACGRHGEVQDLVIGSPFAMYRATIQEIGASPLEELARFPSPATAAAICSMDGQSSGGGSSPPACLLVFPTPEGLTVQVPSRIGHAARAVDLPIVGEPWRLVAGAMATCSEATKIVPSEQIAARRCMVLAGWDGAAVPLAVVPLDDASGLPLQGAVVRPGLDAPVDPEELGSEGGTIAALHLEASSGRLTVLLDGGQLEIWDLTASASRGVWKMSWAAGGPDFKAAAICHAGEREVLAVGRSKARGPVLLRGMLAHHFAGFPGTSVPAAQSAQTRSSESGEEGQLVYAA